MGKVLKFQSASPRPKLRGAMQRGELVRVWRSNLEEGSFCGYLAGIGKEWLLMWVVGDQISFDGLYALRLADISEVEAPDGHHVFIEKALAIRNVHPRLPRNFPLDDTTQVVRAAAEYAAVIITPDAEWLREPSFFGWDEISTVSFDEPYAQVLLDVAGQPPRIDFAGSGFGSVH